MANSIAIRTALKIMNRVLELRNAGLKLKVHKEELRSAVLIDLRSELPAEILYNVEQVLRRRSGRDFFNHLSTVICCAEAALRVAEQMDAYHAEALEMNLKHTRDNFEEKYTATMQYNEFEESEMAEARGMNDAFDRSFHRRAANWGAMDWMSREIALEKAHDEALRMNAALDIEFASIDALAPDEDSKKKFKAIASKYEVGCVMGVNAAHDEALKMNILIDHAEIAAKTYRRPENRDFIEAAHAEALRMNQGIDVALRVLTCMNGAYHAEESLSGVLIRDGFHEVDYLVQVAARKYAQQGTAEITAHGI